MPSVVTITFNPCIDKSSCVEALLPDKKLRCESFKNEAGGGGINVAKAMKKLGENPLAIFLAGGYTGIVLQNLLQAEQVASLVIDTTVDTRENIMIVDKATNLQYRFITPGNAINETHWKQLLKALEDLTEVEYIIVSGSLQPGFPQNIFERIALIASQKNARLVMDVPAEALKQFCIKGAYLFKPNLNELSMLEGKDELNGDAITNAAKKLIKQNVCEVVVVSMGAAGALLVTNDVVEQFMAPPVKKKTTVGAGDSMIAGIVTYLLSKKNIREAIRFGVACGTAATMNEGTRLCTKADAHNLYQLMLQYASATK